LNEKFGQPNDFAAMVQAAHQKDIWVMLDVVINHMGNQVCPALSRSLVAATFTTVNLIDPRTLSDVPNLQASPNHDDFSMFYPFNSTSHYHTYCQIQDWNDEHQVRLCRLSSRAMPPLRHTSQFPHSLSIL
jgi:alpha-amylase